MTIEDLEELVKKTWDKGKPVEGSADKIERRYLASLITSADIKLVAEIGFNAGMSSYTFLEVNPSTVVYSFDLGEYEYVKSAKALMDKNFPNRHHLVIGDSLKTIPRFCNENPRLKFELIFVDGGHNYETVKTDLLNMKLLAKPDTILVIDDLTPWKPWGIGPTKAWRELLEKNIIKQKELYKDGQKVNKIEPPGDRSWAIGKYVF